VTSRSIDNEKATPTSLVVDASTSPVQVGIPALNGWKALHQVEAQALEGLFSATEKVLEVAGYKISNINCVYFCEGPGSTLGLRLAAAFVRTIRWSQKSSDFKVFSYNALDLASILTPQKNAIIQAPFRVGFRFVRISNIESKNSEKKIVPEDEALNKYPDSYHLPDLRKRSKPVDPDKTLVYDLSFIKGLNHLKTISKPCPDILPYNPKAPEFKKWTPRNFTA
jgi:hypothetical protein